MVNPITLQELQGALELVYSRVPATPQYSWPLLNQRLGLKIWVKHENHLPVGAFKVRGGLTYIDWLIQEEPYLEGVVCATRGNHGQSIAFACREAQLNCKVIVPFGNSKEKNAAMRALGADVIEYGQDFQEAIEYAQYLADQLHYHFVPAYHRQLLLGVATAAYEFLQACPDLDVVYVPIGQGSGVCSMALVKELLGHKVEIVGVVTQQAPAYYESMKKGEPMAVEVLPTLADGLACKKAHPCAFNYMKERISRVVKVCEPSLIAAMRDLFADTHNVAEGSGAAGLAAISLELEQLKGKNVGFVLTGGNIDSDVFAKVLIEQLGTPSVSGSQASEAHPLAEPRAPQMTEQGAPQC